MLNAVVLPAPLGPINATISPASMENSRLFTATRPPNRRVRFLISRMATHFIPDEPARPGRKSRRFHLRLLLSLALYATTDPPQRFSVKRFMRASPSLCHFGVAAPMLQLGEIVWGIEIEGSIRENANTA